MNDIANKLVTIKAFCSLSYEERQSLAHYFHIKHYVLHQEVIAYQESSDWVYFLVSGTVRAKMFTREGRAISYQDIFAGEMFGELAAIDQLPRSTHVIATDNIEVLQISGNHFMSLVLSQPQVAQATLAKMAGLVRFLCDRIYEFGALSVNQRIRAELVRLAGPVVDGRRVIIENLPTHQELADRLTTHREAVSRELNRLEKSGIIVRERQCLIINNIDELRELIEVST